MERVDRGSFSPDDISEWFWETIENAGRSRDRLAEVLRQMSRDEVIRFHNEFQEAAIQLVDEPFISHMDEDVSEDSVQDVAEWVVSQGKAYYSNVWKQPDRVPKRIESGTLTTFAGVADRVFWDRFNESIPDVL